MSGMLIKFPNPWCGVILQNPGDLTFLYSDGLPAVMLEEGF